MDPGEVGTGRRFVVASEPFEGLPGLVPARPGPARPERVAPVGGEPIEVAVASGIAPGPDREQQRPVGGARRWLGPEQAPPPRDPIEIRRPIARPAVTAADVARVDACSAGKLVRGIE